MNLRFELLVLASLAVLNGIATAQDTELPLKAGDRIALSIGGVGEVDAVQINKIYSISDSGTINLVHVGEVKAAGLKPSLLQRAVEQAYIQQEIFTRPTVTVTIDRGSTPDRLVYVVSGCNSNGPVPYHAEMTILKAISVAKGLSPFAKPGKTILLRNGTSIRLDLRDAESDPSKDVSLRPEDRIIITE